MRKNLSTYRLHESLGYLTYQASGVIRKEIGLELSRRGFPIKAEQFAALVYIWDEDGQPQRVLAEKLYRDKTTVTRLVTELESLGYVKRVTGRQDAREKLIFLTESGKQLMAEVTRLVQDILDVAQKGIDPGKVDLQRGPAGYPRKPSVTAVRTAKEFPVIPSCNQYSCTQNTVPFAPTAGGLPL
jgi:DNA-binding MarR family transcriptional regulator